VTDAVLPELEEVGLVGRLLPRALGRSREEIDVVVTDAATL
jgi:hypothetical protein